jgi:hypothetical protein
MMTDFLLTNGSCPSAASRRPGPPRRRTPATSSATRTGRRSPASTSRRSRGGDRRGALRPVPEPIPPCGAVRDQCHRLGVGAHDRAGAGRATEPMRMWPISTRVNKPENDDPSIVEPIELSTSAAWRRLALGSIAAGCAKAPEEKVAAREKPASRPRNCCSISNEIRCNHFSARSARSW